MLFLITELELHCQLHIFTTVIKIAFNLANFFYIVYIRARGVSVKWEEKLSFIKSLSQPLVPIRGKSFSLIFLTSNVRFIAPLHGIL